MSSSQQNNNLSPHQIIWHSSLAVLQIIFITLKVIGLIEWPWILVLTPLWINFALALLLYAAIFIIGLIYWIYVTIKTR